LIVNCREGDNDAVVLIDSWEGQAVVSVDHTASARGGACSRCWDGAVATRVGRGRDSDSTRATLSRGRRNGAVDGGGHNVDHFKDGRAGGVEASRSRDRNAVNLQPVVVPAVADGDGAISVLHAVVGEFGARAGDSGSRGRAQIHASCREAAVVGRAALRGDQRSVAADSGGHRNDRDLLSAHGGVACVIRGVANNHQAVVGIELRDGDRAISVDHAALSIRRARARGRDGALADIRSRRPDGDRSRAAVALHAVLASDGGSSRINNIEDRRAC